MHYLMGTNLMNWIQLLWKNKGRISFSYLPRALGITLINIITFPFYLLELLIYRHAIIKTNVEEEPLFILGHWRNGTTYLANILSKDPQFAFWNIAEVMAPSYFLCYFPFLRFLTRCLLPETRPMDNIKMDLASLQEEEYAMANISPFSYYHVMSFPKHWKQYERYCLFNDLSESEVAQWMKSYLFLLKKITFKHKGKRLLLKNPTNTCRIALLLQMFPRAKFIHIQRDPYDVYSSTNGLYKALFPMFTMQGILQEQEREQLQLKLYCDFYQRYFQEKILIPAENLIEIAYEDFVKTPIEHIEKIYQVLKISEFNNNLPAFMDYIESQKNYRKNKNVLTNTAREHIGKQCSFLFANWGYSKKSSID